MLIYSMGVSVDGFIADREGAFDWSVPNEEQFRFHITQTRELGGFLLGRKALRDHAGVGDGSVDARDRG
jgi:dihydrofolate reductase